LPPCCKISSAADVVSGCPAETPAFLPMIGGRSGATGVSETSATGAGSFVCGGVVQPAKKISDARLENRIVRPAHCRNMRIMYLLSITAFLFSISSIANRRQGVLGHHALAWLTGVTTVRNDNSIASIRILIAKPCHQIGERPWIEGAVRYERSKA
jgi:hypothetical protein